MQQFFLAQNDVYGHENGYRKVGQNGYIFSFSHFENVMYGVVSLYRDTYSRHGMKACTHVEDRKCVCRWLKSFPVCRLQKRVFPCGYTAWLPSLLTDQLSLPGMYPRCSHFNRAVFSTE